MLSFYVFRVYRERINAAMNQDVELIQVRVTTKSRRPRVEDAQDGSLRVHVSAAPEKGKANAAVRAAIGTHFGVPKSSVELVSGATSRDKTFRVTFG